MTIEWRKQWFEFVRKIKKKKKISHKEAMAQSSILWPKEKEKIKKCSGDSLVLNLVPTKDILMEVSKVKTKQFVVGFAAETQNLIQSALEKLRNKKLDLIVANDISAPGIGFQSDNNQVSLIDSSERIENLPRMTKKEIANILLDKIKQLQP